MNPIRSLSELPDTTPFPALFVGHGNPMNAIMDNSFRQTWQQLGRELPVPKAIVVVSAHWESNGTLVTANELPPTIHDFYGFPKALFDQQYAAPGAPWLSKAIAEKHGDIHEDLQWGLDHGTWSVLLPMFPEASIPVIQLSLSRLMSLTQHLELAKELQWLRSKGILVIGSGNLVHNLRLVRWEGPAFDWAIEFDAKAKEFIDSGNTAELLNMASNTQIGKLSVPTAEHFLPLLYTLGMKSDKDQVSYFNTSMDAGSISMRSFVLSTG